MSDQRKTISCCNIGDRVTRLGEFLPVVRLFSLGSFFKITEVAQIFGLLFSMVKLHNVLISTKMGWASCWAIFSQTHLVTLIQRKTKESSQTKLFIL
jgi:hypothetical protein